MASRSLGEAEQAVRDRLISDAALAALVGMDPAGDVRYSMAYPAELLEDTHPNEFPRISVDRVPADRMLADGFGEVELMIDLWVLRGHGGAGGEDADDVLEQMDSRVLELIDGQQWAYTPPGGSAVTVNGRVLDGGGNRHWRHVLRRSRNYSIGVW